MTRLAMTVMFGSVTWWHKYLDLAFPGRKPADWAEQLKGNRALMEAPGRMKAMRGMGNSSPARRRSATRQHPLSGAHHHGFPRPGLGRPAGRRRRDRRRDASRSG